MQAVAVALQEQLEAQADRLSLENTTDQMESSGPELLGCDFVSPSPVSIVDNEDDEKSSLKEEVIVEIPTDSARSNSIHLVSQQMKFIIKLWLLMII